MDQMTERNRRLAANILAGRSPLTDEVLRTIRSNALADLNVPAPRVLQLVDEVERLRAERAELDNLKPGDECPGERVTYEPWAQRQAEHERAQHDDPSHDRSSCWCCCDTCDDSDD